MMEEKEEGEDSLKFEQGVGGGVGVGVGGGKGGVDSLVKSSNYTIKRPLADSRTGRIWLCKDNSSNEYVVVKQRVKLERTIDGLISHEHLEEEKSIHLTLSNMKNFHPCFARAYESLSDDCFDYIVMEYCNGGELFTFTDMLYKHSVSRTNEKYNKISIISNDLMTNNNNNNNTTTNRQARLKDVYTLYTKHIQYIFKQIVECVHWMHSSANVCHLNICLENIMTTIPFDTKNLFLLEIQRSTSSSFSLDTTPEPHRNSSFIGESYHREMLMPTVNTPLGASSSGSTLLSPRPPSLSRQNSEACAEAVANRRVVLDSEFPVLVKLVDFGMAKKFGKDETEKEKEKEKEKTIRDSTKIKLSSSPNICSVKPENKSIDFTFNKQVGKVSCMAPEVYSQSKYDARMADVWSLGVVLYMMLLRKKMYELPSNADANFKSIMDGNFKTLPHHIDILNCLPADAIDVMDKIFKPVEQRITMEELIQHRFLKVANDLPMPVFTIQTSAGIEGS